MDFINFTFRDPVVDKFIFLCQSIEKPIPDDQTAVEIYPMPHKTTRAFRSLTFIPQRYQSTNSLNFGQLPKSSEKIDTSKKISPVKKEIKIINIHKDGQSIYLLSLTIVICSAGLLFILVYFSTKNT